MSIFNKAKEEVKEGVKKEKEAVTEVKGTEMVKAGENLPAVSQSSGSLTKRVEGLMGFENFDEGDLVIPRFSIVQPTSKEGTAGTFRSNLTGEERAEMRITPITYSKGMVLWAEELGEDPQCRSNNALVPDPAIEEPKSDRCNEVVGNRLRPVCPYAFWKEKKEAPECKLTYNLIAIDMETERPFYISFHGSSVRSVKALISHIWQMRRNFFDVNCQMRLNKVTNQKGAFYVVEFVDFAENTPGRFKGLFDSFKDYDLNLTTEAEKEAKAKEAPSFDPEKF